MSEEQEKKRVRYLYKVTEKQIVITVEIPIDEDCLSKAVRVSRPEKLKPFPVEGEWSQDPEGYCGTFQEVFAVLDDSDSKNTEAFEDALAEAGVYLNREFAALVRFWKDLEGGDEYDWFHPEDEDDLRALLVSEGHEWMGPAIDLSIEGRFEEAKEAYLAAKEKRKA